MNKKVKALILFGVYIIGLLLIFIFKQHFQKNITLSVLVASLNILLFWGIKELVSYNTLLKEVTKGIPIINQGLHFNFQYLDIALNPENNAELIVKNDLIWKETEIRKNKSGDNLLQLLIADFEILSNTSQWKRYLTDKTIFFKLISYETNAEKLLAEEKKIYQ